MAFNEMSLVAPVLEQFQRSLSSFIVIDDWSRIRTAKVDTSFMQDIKGCLPRRMNPLIR